MQNITIFTGRVSVSTIKGFKMNKSVVAHAQQVQDNSVITHMQLPLATALQLFFCIKARGSGRRWEDPPPLRLLPQHCLTPPETVKMGQLAEGGGVRGGGREGSPLLAGGGGAQEAHKTSGEFRESRGFWGKAGHAKLTQRAPQHQEEEERWGAGGRQRWLLPGRDEGRNISGT